MRHRQHDHQNADPVAAGDEHGRKNRSDEHRSPKMREAGR